VPIDYASGLPEERDFILSEPPAVEKWAENLLFAVYDPDSGISMWLHLGTMAHDWTMWEDRVLLKLPGAEGVLSLRGYHHTAPQRRPAGPGLEFHQREPWRRWHVDFDGVGLFTPEAEMLAGVARDGTGQPFSISLDMECVTPAWDARTASSLASGGGSMDSQEWADDHYEQLVRATGTVTLQGEEMPFTGYGWRDHSRGPRDHALLQRWGGHVILGCSYPGSGRAWGFSRYYRDDGLITLEGGYVFVDGVFEHARVLTAPRLKQLDHPSKPMRVALEWSGGIFESTLACDRTLWTSMQRSLAVGKDLDGVALMYVLDFGRCDWDGETGHFYSERSDRLNQLAPEPFHPVG
jgi:hypothetical protein